jgi:hypothetical protein
MTSVTRLGENSFKYINWGLLLYIFLLNLENLEKINYAVCEYIFVVINIVYFLNILVFFQKKYCHAGWDNRYLRTRLIEDLWYLWMRPWRRCRRPWARRRCTRSFGDWGPLSSAVRTWEAGSPDSETTRRPSKTSLWMEGRVSRW